MRLIETTTTRVSASVAKLVEAPDDLPGLVEQVSKDLLHEIRQTYPLQGRISRLTPESNVILNIGAQQGVTSGLVLRVFGDDAALNNNGKDMPAPVGRLEVTRVEAQACQARVLEQSEPLMPGNKVREMLGE
jgi:hypothetical protein